MSTTYALVLRAPRAKDGLCPIHLRLTSQRVPRYRAVPDMALSAAHWNARGTLEKANWVRRGHPYADDYNERLRKLLRRVQALLDERPTLTAEQLHAALAGADTGGDFLAFLKTDVARRAASGHPRTAEKFDNIRSKLQSFVLGLPHPTGRYGLRHEDEATRQRRAAVVLPFAALTVRWVRDYEQYLIGLGNRDTTVQKELSFLNTALRRAVEEDLLAEEKNPFRRIKRHEGKPRPKAKLTDEEVARLEALPADQLTRGQQRARDTWLLQYYLLGSRIGDVVTLRWRDVGPAEVAFTEHKTGKPKLAPRTAGLDAVLARCAPAGIDAAPPEGFVLPYLDAAAAYAQFPAGLSWAELSRLPAYRPVWLALLPRMESATSTVNGNLAAVAEAAGIAKHLTTHTARHSFADRGRRLGVATADMRDMLNHHSIAQTEEYYGQLERAGLSEKARSIYER